MNRSYRLSRSCIYLTTQRCEKYREKNKINEQANHKIRATVHGSNRLLNELDMRCVHVPSLSRARCTPAIEHINLSMYRPSSSSHIHMYYLQWNLCDHAVHIHCIEFLPLSFNNNRIHSLIFAVYVCNTVKCVHCTLCGSNARENTVVARARAYSSFNVFAVLLSIHAVLLLAATAIFRLIRLFVRCIREATYGHLAHERKRMPYDEAESWTTDRPTDWLNWIANICNILIWTVVERVHEINSFLKN